MRLNRIYMSKIRPRNKRSTIEIGKVTMTKPYLEFEIEGQVYSSKDFDIYVPLNSKIVQKKQIPAPDYAHVGEYALVNKADIKFIDIKVGDLVTFIDRGDNFILFNRVANIRGQGIE